MRAYIAHNIAIIAIIWLLYGNSYINVLSSPKNLCAGFVPMSPGSPKEFRLD